MEAVLRWVIVVVSSSLLAAGQELKDWDYDYSANIDCLREPMTPQYGGGIVQNPKMEFGMQGWDAFGEVTKVDVVQAPSGNNFLMASNRHDPNDSFTQTFDLKKDVHYSFSAWMQISKGKEIVAAFLKIPDEDSIVVGSVIARAGCWSMLKGGFTIYEDVSAALYFLSNNTRVDLWLDNVALKEFTKKQWTDQQNQSIDRNRKRKLRVSVTNQDGEALVGARIVIDQEKTHFVVGASSTEAIIHNKAYQEWFVRRFTATSFNNELKWYYIEGEEGRENYTVPDAMVAFFGKHGIPVRGHTILWNKPKMNNYWLLKLPPRELLKAAVRHIGSVMSRYYGQLMSWDVVNENLHFSFWEDRVKPNITNTFFKIAQALDGKTIKYLNEYATLEYPLDMDAIPSVYIEKIRTIRASAGNENLVVGIGQQGHFTHERLNISYVRAALDVLGATTMPIWLTELDTERGPNQAAELEEVMREAFSHPAVHGMILWAGWKPQVCRKECLEDKNYKQLAKGCARICLTDDNFKNLPLGDLVDRLINEWKTTNLIGTTNKEGVYENLVFHGDYSLTLTHPSSDQKVVRFVNVTKTESEPLDVQITL